MTERERRSLRPTANWQVWTMVFVVLVLVLQVRHQHALDRLGCIADGALVGQGPREVVSQLLVFRLERGRNGKGAFLWPTGDVLRAGSIPDGAQDE